MPVSKQPARDIPAELAKQLAETLLQDRLVPRFVDSYVVTHGRYALQTHAARYRELLALLTREALLAATLRALEEVNTPPQEKKKRAALRERSKPPAFRRKFLMALARQQNWTAGDALDFQTELQVYEEVLRRPGARRTRKVFEAADHPFVDRCAILLDPSFIEQARIAAGRALTELERLAATVTENVLQSRSR
ncbi:MAG TPA: hypothetical protein VHE23_02395 [Candidatus Acidoferrales bacterium]|nr:hypothetical protein [Candidatus Acidoferrales bacterium]